MLIRVALLVLLFSCTHDEPAAPPEEPNWYCFRITGTADKPAAVEHAPCFRSLDECQTSRRVLVSDAIGGLQALPCEAQTAAWVGAGAHDGQIKAFTTIAACRALASGCKSVR